MKKNRKDQNTPKKRGIISVVQSPNEGKNTSENLNTSDTEKTPRNPDEHGVISVVQAPDEE